MAYEIQSHREGEGWSNDGLGEPGANQFETEADAEVAIEALRKLGDDWADAEYRVIEIS